MKGRRYPVKSGAIVQRQQQQNLNIKWQREYNQSIDSFSLPTTKYDDGCAEEEEKEDEVHREKKSRSTVNDPYISYARRVGSS